MPLDAGTRGLMQAHLGHDFSRLRIHVNGTPDEESVEGTPGAGLPLIPAPGAPSEEDLTRGAQPLDQPAQTTRCPTKTVVDKLIDTTPEGFGKGYRTGYGATAVMRVEPASTNWDGTQIVESLKQTKNTCPEEFAVQWAQHFPSRRRSEFEYLRQTTCDAQSLLRPSFYALE